MTKAILQGYECKADCELLVDWTAEAMNNGLKASADVVITGK